MKVKTALQPTTPTLKDCPSKLLRQSGTMLNRWKTSSSNILSFFHCQLVFTQEIKCEFVSVSLSAPMHLIDPFAAKVMVKLMDNYKWVCQNVAVQNCNGLVFCGVAASKP